MKITESVIEKFATESLEKQSYQYVYAPSIASMNIEHASRVGRGRRNGYIMKNKKIPDNQITVYQTPDGKINIEVLYANENIWLPQKRMAELFDVDRTVVTKHLGNIFLENELQEDTVCAKFAHTAEDFSVVHFEK